MRIWVDCTAAPHPLVLRPIIERLRGQGHDVEITARDYGQTVGVLERLGLAHRVLGRHGGASMLGKGAALATRSTALLRWARPRRFDLALAHGSVDLAMVATGLRIPSAQMQDYEYAGLQRQLAFRAARRVLVPDAIPVAAMARAGAAARKLVRFPGLKEDYYLADFSPDPSVPEALGLDRERVLVVVRPPPETSAYHAQNDLYDGVLDRLAGEEGVQTVVIARTGAQREAVGRRLAAGEWRRERVIAPRQTIDAQSLIAYSDVVVGAGGTMNREAVALGVPVYTIFSGRMGAVDEALIRAGSLRALASADAIELRKREGRPGPRHPRDADVLLEGVLAALG